MQGKCPWGAFLGKQIPNQNDRHDDTCHRNEPFDENIAFFTLQSTAQKASEHGSGRNADRKSPFHFADGDQTDRTDEQKCRSQRIFDGVHVQKIQTRIARKGEYL